MSPSLEQQLANAHELIEDLTARNTELTSMLKSVDQANGMWENRVIEILSRIKEQIND